MSTAATFTKTGTKAQTAAKLPADIFGLEVKSYDLLKQAYLAYLANGRQNAARTLKRGEVSGGGRKPWRQKGTGRARVGSSRTPIWRGGGITFGPTGNENYRVKLSQKAKHQALRQALSIKAREGNLLVVEDFPVTGKVKDTLKLSAKLPVKGNVLLVVSQKDELIDRATRNLETLNAVSARFLNVYGIMNADTIIITKPALKVVGEWLGVNHG